MGLVHMVKSLCESNNISISRLEKTLNFANGSIRKWDNAVPAGDRLCKVAEYFDVSIDYLLERTSNPLINRDFAMELLYSDLPAEAVSKLSSYAEFLRDQYTRKQSKII